MKVLHVLAQLPVKTGSGVYFTNVIDGLKNYEVEQAAIYGTTPEYDFNILDTVYEVEFEGEDIDFYGNGNSKAISFTSVKSLIFSLPIIPNNGSFIVQCSVPL